MNVAIHEVPVPDQGPPHPLVHVLVGCDRRVWFELYGHDDFHEDLAGYLVALTPTEYQTRRHWVALPAGVLPTACAPSDALGFAHLGLGLKEDLTTGDFFVGVPLAHRDRGVGQALYERVLGAMDGRTVLQTWCPSPELSANDQRALTARSGSGTLDATSAEARWLLHRGFELEQAERYSRLDIERDTLASDLAVHARVAAAHAGADYELVGWEGTAPDHLHDELADLTTRFSVDQPTAGLHLDEQVWDADRVRVSEQRMEQRGNGRVRIAARHLPSGRLVAVTELTWPGRNAAGVWQQITLVAREHRGHRLGLWTKAANLLQLLEVNPDAARVHTWNADENTHMLAINRALGFRPLGLEGAWQKRW